MNKFGSYLASLIGNISFSSMLQGIARLASPHTAVQAHPLHWRTGYAVAGLMRRGEAVRNHPDFIKNFQKKFPN
jgi:hypothetical protein